MRKHWKGLVVVAVTLVVIAAAGVFLATRESPDMHRFRQVKVGMNLDEVKRLFPDREITCIGESRGQVPWGVALDEMYIVIWVDAEQRVTSAEYAESESWLERVFGHLHF